MPSPPWCIKKPQVNVDNAKLRVYIPQKQTLSLLWGTWIWEVPPLKRGFFFQKGKSGLKKKSIFQLTNLPALMPLFTHRRKCLLSHQSGISCVKTGSGDQPDQVSFRIVGGSVRWVMLDFFFLNKVCPFYLKGADFALGPPFFYLCHSEVNLSSSWGQKHSHFRQVSGVVRLLIRQKTYIGEEQSQ